MLQKGGNHLSIGFLYIVSEELWNLILPVAVLCIAIRTTLLAWRLTCQNAELIHACQIRHNHIKIIIFCWGITLCLTSISFYTVNYTYKAFISIIFVGSAHLKVSMTTRYYNFLCCSICSTRYIYGNLGQIYLPPVDIWCTFSVGRLNDSTFC